MIQLCKRDPRKDRPVEFCSVLVAYEGTVFSGVYSNGLVSLFPEEFGKIKLVDCEWWALFPSA